MFPKTRNACLSDSPHWRSRGSREVMTVDVLRRPSGEVQTSRSCLCPPYPASVVGLHRSIIPCCLRKLSLRIAVTQAALWVLRTPCEPKTCPLECLFVCGGRGELTQNKGKQLFTGLNSLNTVTMSYAFFSICFLYSPPAFQQMSWT